MNAQVKAKSAKQSNKPYWGKAQPKIFTPEEMREIAAYMNELRLMELKISHLQKYVTYDLASILRWVSAKGYNSWLLTTSGVKTNKLMGINQIKQLRVGDTLTLNIFNTTDRNNGFLHLHRVDENTWAAENTRIGTWLEAMLTRNLYPNKMSDVIYDLFVKGKKDIGNNRSDAYMTSFERIRALAKKDAGKDNETFKAWVEAAGPSTIDALRAMGLEARKIKMRKAA